MVVFVFTMTGIVYATQHNTNPAIQTPIDALYFTVTSLTTTGYGDITLPGPTGLLLSVFVMICGVTLFFRLAQVVFRPYKVRFPCDACGLQRHEPDAVHCKACGNLLNIPMREPTDALAGVRVRFQGRHTATALDTTTRCSRAAMIVDDSSSAAGVTCPGAR